MMRLARKASLLVAFYVLTSAATAYAECAWVLWEQRKAFFTAAPHKDWTMWAILRTHDSRADCQGDVNKLMHPRNSWRIGYEQLSEDSVFLHVGDVRDVKRAICLPDTIDPRPKGGS